MSSTQDYLQSLLAEAERQQRLIRRLAEALPVGSIKSGFHRVSSKRQGDLKKGLSRKDRYAGKLAVKKSPEDVPKHRLKSGYSD